MFACTWLGRRCRSDTTTTMSQRRPLVSQLAHSTYVHGLLSAMKQGQLSEGLGRLHVNICCLLETKSPLWNLRTARQLSPPRPAVTTNDTTVSSSPSQLVTLVHYQARPSISDLSGALQWQYAPVYLFTSPPETA